MLQSDHFLDHQIYSKGYVNNEPVFDRKLTLIGVFHSFQLGVRVITRMLVCIRNRRSDLTYCNVTDTCCFYEITSSTQPTYITLNMFTMN